MKPSQKIHSLLARSIEKHSWVKVRSHMLAHSGATVCGDGGDDHLHGEIPRDAPSIDAQVKSVKGSRSSRVTVLIEGGINEVGAVTIVNPRTTSDFIRQAVEKSCYHDMRRVLAEVARRFPKAEIFLLGYYPILSRRAEGEQIKDFLEAEGVDRDDVKNSDDFVENAVANCRLFVAESDRHLKQAAREISAEFGRNCQFVASGFGDAESLFGRNSLLFPPWAGDPMMSLRARKCTLAITRGKTGVHCYLAAAAHPDERGAERYAEQVIAARGRR
ncbi:hypothetical protein ACFQY0_12595 [Haloferula chungangensis]|uniref:Uncharacterized protein n=1 Tax=Haloferula chungangensis TaxID=1048331 RepID=A0ABW2L9M8_9BACT